MSMTFRATFFKDISFPIKIEISGSSRSPSMFQIKLVDARALADLLENPSLSGDSVSFTSSGNVFRHTYWKSLDNFMLVTKSSRTSFTANEASMLASQLIDVIPSSSTEEPISTVQPYEDLLVGAKKRMDDNLRHIFS